MNARDKTRRDGCLAAENRQSTYRHEPYLSMCCTWLLTRNMQEPAMQLSRGRVQRCASARRRIRRPGNDAMPKQGSTENSLEGHGWRRPRGAKSKKHQETVRGAWSRGLAPYIAGLGRVWGFIGRGETFRFKKEFGFLFEEWEPRG
jgi:hypothetical protein